MLALFLFGTFWWYGITLLFLIGAVIAIEKEEVMPAIIILILYGLYFQFLAGVDFFGYLLKNPLHLLYTITAYVVCGLVWSGIKWALFVNTEAEKQKDTWRYFLKNNNLPSSTKKLTLRKKRDWDSSNYHKKPMFSGNKKKITIWVTYWPLSLIWSLLNDFVKKLMHLIVIRFHKVYEAIANKAYKEIDNIEIIEIIDEPKKGINKFKVTD